MGTPVKAATGASIEATHLPHMSKADAADFGVLKRWIKDFKTQQGREPFFEDFTADIGTANWTGMAPASLASGP